MFSPHLCYHLSLIVFHLLQFFRQLHNFGPECLDLCISTELDFTFLSLYLGFGLLQFDHWDFFLIIRDALLGVVVLGVALLGLVLLVVVLLGVVLLVVVLLLLGLDVDDVDGGLPLLPPLTKPMFDLNKKNSKKNIV